MPDSLRAVRENEPSMDKFCTILGNPNHKGLPNWPTYNATNTATMHFDNQCVLKPQMDKELFDLLK